MKKYLYADLYELEEKHWWHIAKRKTCLKFIKKYLKVRKPTILDVGCGTGKNVEEFSKLGTTYGIDNSQDALDFCIKKRHLKNISLGDAQKTGFPDKKFDLVTMLDVLEHTDDSKTLREASRILKSEGLLLITVPAFQFMWSNWDVVLHHKRRYTKKSLERVLSAEGFEVVKISYLYSFLLPPVFIVRKIKNLISKDSYSSDFKLGFSVFNDMLSFASNLERNVVLLLGIPFGLSIIVIAKKNLN